jgi:two-component system chemotaxis response regulator CheB
VAIGASTGGPAALLAILSALPKTFELPVLVVLHISETFATAMAEWLDGQLALPVRCAVDGEPLPAPGQRCVLMAPPDRHLEVAGGRLRLSRSPERHSCRPSVDVLFESLAREVGPRTIACLLTGMGRDGAQGLLAIRQSGGLTMAQDEASSVVFGMPGEAIKLGAASHVLSLSDLASRLARMRTTF